MLYVCCSCLYVTIWLLFCCLLLLFTVVCCLQQLYLLLFVVFFYIAIVFDCVIELLVNVLWLLSLLCGVWCCVV